MGNKHKGCEAPNNRSRGLSVRVENGNIEAAIRQLKKRVTNEGLIRELRMKEYYEKPSAKRKREQAEARNRWKRKQRKLNEW